jgi:hypothetical protein
MLASRVVAHVPTKPHHQQGPEETKRVRRSKIAHNRQRLIVGVMFAVI